MGSNSSQQVILVAYLLSQNEATEASSWLENYGDKNYTAVAFLRPQP